MNTILIDTSVIIDFLRQPQNDEAPLLKLVDTRKPLAISIITHAELYSGKSTWENLNVQENIEGLLQDLSILPISESISKHAGKLRSEKNIGLFDALIAATALEENIPLATLNIKHFAGIKGLTITNS
ncbi:MAG: type II toxin-antitoxin system VapC family toxin [Microgenomates group bacterium]